MARKRGGDDPAWSEPAIGGDPDAPKRPPGSRTDHGMVAWIGEAFWRECDIVPLTVSRYGSKGKMNANITFMLQNHTKDEIEASFKFFRADIPNLNLASADSCWDLYFRHRGGYLRSARRSREGARAGEAVRKAGDITVDNDRFHVHDPGDARPDAGIVETDDDVS